MILIYERGIPVVCSFHFPECFTHSYICVRLGFQAKSSLYKLYETTESKEIEAKVITAFFLSGDTQ